MTQNETETTTEELIQRIAADAADYREEYEMSEDAKKVAESDRFAYFVVGAHSYEEQVKAVEGVEFGTDEEIEVRDRLKSQLVKTLDTPRADARDEVGRMTSVAYIVPVEVDA